MTKRTIKWFSVILIIALIMSIAACAQDAAPQAQPSDSTPAASSESTQDAESQTQETIVVRQAFERVPGLIYLDGEDEFNNSWIDLIKQELNIELVTDCEYRI